jgi:predicted MPP superfamily phosphohydrolase
MTLTLVAVFGVFQVILFLMHADIYQTLSIAFGWNWTWLQWLFFLLSITFVTASVFSHLFCNKAVRVYYTFAAYWFGLTQFLFSGTAFFFVLSYCFYRENYYVSPALLAGLCLGIMFLIHSYATWRTAHPRLTRVTITLPNLPSFWHGKKIVFVSDVHLGAVLGAEFAKKVVDMIKSESPATVLIGGDIFDGVKCHSQSLIAPFLTLQPPQGIYFSSGNHEYIEDTERLLQEIPRAGIRVLRNESIDIHGIQFAGVDWKDSHKKHEFEKVIAEMHIDRTKPSILMRHEPNHLEVAEHAGVTLTLSGHTHAGQIWPLGYITHSIYKGFDYGLKKLNDMTVYTSSGVGTWGPPLRFGTKAEIVVITLQ